MNKSLYGDSQLFEAFVRSAQYFVRIKAQEDVWNNLGKFITTYFPAEWIVFARRDSGNGITLQYCTLTDTEAAQRILAPEAQAIVADILDNGFLATQTIRTPDPMMTVFLPIVEEYQTEYVMLIGHRTADPLPRELVNIYLAIAGLAGTTLERLHSENELNRHRAHLEELVEERTAELAKTKKRNELILHSVGEGICGIDLQENITFINPFAAQLLGWGPSELIGRNVQATFHYKNPNDCPCSTGKCLIQSALVDGHAKFGNDEMFSHKDGTRFPVEFTIAPIVDENNITGAVIVFRDITERKKAEMTLQEKQEELETQNEEIRTNNMELASLTRSLQEARDQSELYLDLMGHDISNMHQIVLGQLELAQEVIAEDGKLDVGQKEFIDTSIGTLERSARLIDNVRKLQKLRSGDYKDERIDLGKLLAEVVDENSKVAGQAININYSPTPGEFVKANPLLKDVFTNLVGNAIKHSNGTTKIDIVIKEVRENGNAFYSVAVEDNGPGIPDDKKDEVFDRFRRGQTKARGTGLGLYIVKTLVASFNGRVDLENRVPGDHTKGSRFIVYLPVAEK